MRAKTPLQNRGNPVSLNPYSNPTLHVEDSLSADGAAPAMWNPNAAANWSLLFSPAFGAWLHMKNWQALGEPEKAATAKQWAIWSAVFLVGIGLLSAVLPENRTLDALSRPAGIGMLVAWYVGNARAQMNYVKERFGKEYPRKGWLKPIAFGFLFLLAVFAIGVVIGIIGVVAARA